MAFKRRRARRRGAHAAFAAVFAHSARFVAAMIRKAGPAAAGPAARRTNIQQRQGLLKN
ncbi:hypothetical protein [[Pseudomonas] boreopolis]|jgi:hypothetical protein|uniref:hypothetical protein n=1 Tax=Xanthomonas boreopolis TaxID=86183 RepID=UPI0032DC8A0B